MNYQVTKNKIRSGDLIAFRGTGPISRFVCRVTGSSYSHVGIAVIINDRIMVVQDKEWHGMIVIPLSQMLPCDWIGTGANWNNEVQKFAFSHIGQKYSYVNALLAGFGIKPVGHNSICSEFAAAVLKKSGVLKDTTAILTPGSLVNCLLDLGHPLEKIID